MSNTPHVYWGTTQSFHVIRVVMFSKSLEDIWLRWPQEGLYCEGEIISHYELNATMVKMYG